MLLDFFHPVLRCSKGAPLAARFKLQLEIPGISDLSTQNPTDYSLSVESSEDCFAAYRGAAKRIWRTTIGFQSPCVETGAAVNKSFVREHLRGLVDVPKQANHLLRYGWLEANGHMSESVDKRWKDILY